MKTTPEKTEQRYRYYMLKTVVGIRQWRVRYEELEQFIDTFGDLIIGAGDTQEDAILDYSIRKEKMKRR